MAIAESESMIRVGTVGRPHGVRGELKVIPETDDPGRLEAVGRLFVGATPERVRAYGVENVRFQYRKGGIAVPLVKFEGVDTREAAEALRKQALYAVEDDLPALEEGEYFLHELAGLTAVTEDGTVVGTVEDVLEGPAQDLLMIERGDAEPVMIPLVDAFIVEIDFDGGRIVIAPIEGLLD